MEHSFSVVFLSFKLLGSSVVTIIDESPVSQQPHLPNSSDACILTATGRSHRTGATSCFGALSYEDLALVRTWDGIVQQDSMFKDERILQIHPKFSRKDP